MTLTRLKKFRTIPFLNTSDTETATYARIGKSTVFDLKMNANIETNEFIENEMPTDDVTYYKPELEQELQANKGDECFDYLYEMFKTLPTGEDVKKNLLIVFDGNVGTAEAIKYDAWDAMATLQLDHFDSVAEKIYFKFSIYSRTNVQCTVTNGVPAIVVTP